MNFDPQFKGASPLRRSLALAACASALSCGNAMQNSSGHWNEGSNAGVDASVVTQTPATWPSQDAAATSQQGSTQDAGASSTVGSSSVLGCTGKMGTSGDHTFSITSSYLPRTGVVHVPASYDASKETMLVMNFHGFSMTGADEALLTGMNATSDAHGFVLAYPDGIAESWNAGDCCGDSWIDAVDDVQFTRDLITYLTTTYCIDAKRIFVAGFSNGGFMAHRLGCELADQIAAIAPVSGVLGIDPATCKPSRPIPVYDTHGTADPVVPFNGGTPISPIDIGGPITFRSVADTISFWRTSDDCLGAPSIVYSNGDASCQNWGSCNQNADVTLCTITGGGHAWPEGQPVEFDGISGGLVSTDIDTNEEIYSFFVAHPMP